MEKPSGASGSPPQSQPQYTVPVPPPRPDDPSPSPPAHPDDRAPGPVTVPVPVRGSDPTQALPAVAEPTAVIPSIDSPLRSPPEAAGGVAPVPPAWGPGASWTDPSGASPALAPPREALRTAGLILLGVTLGWWLFFLVRLVWWLVQIGPTDTIVISTIDAVPEETVVAAVVSAAAAATLILARVRGRRGAVPAAVAVLLFLVTLGVTVWRLI